MCQILSFYEQDFNNSKLDRAEMLKQSQKNHSDGTAIVSYDPNKDKLQRKRKMHFNTAKEKETVNENPVVNFHTRTATAGEVTKRNIHFWEKQGWLFAHNGFVSNMSTAKRAKTESDSKRFFNYLWGIGALGGEEPDINAIKAAVKRKELSGRFVLIDKENSEAYYFGDFYTYLFNNELVISSEEESFIREKGFWGAKFWKEGYTEQKLEGIYKINFDKRKFEAIDRDYQIWRYGTGKKYGKMYNHTNRYGAYNSTASSYGGSNTLKNELSEDSEENGYNHELEKDSPLTEEEKRIQEEYEKIVSDVPEIEEFNNMEEWRAEMKRKYKFQKQLAENQAKEEHNTSQKRLTNHPKSY